ncbi:MAG TPA: VOC family protein [Promineifilum sp.]|nr:VOC family protein [Promineifilum sp.]
MKATQIFETVLYASDLAAAERFYADVLGLEIISRFGIALAFRCTGGVLLIFEPDKAALPNRGVPSHGTHGAGHLAFAATAGELDGWRAQLQAHGVAIEMEVNWEMGGTSIYFRDPAGNSIELAPPTLWGRLLDSANVSQL